MIEPTTTARRDDDWRINLVWNVLLVTVVAATSLGALTFGAVGILNG